MDQISGLTLLEVSELVSALKVGRYELLSKASTNGRAEPPHLLSQTRLNITEVAMPAASAPAGGAAAPAAAEAPAEVSQSSRCGMFKGSIAKWVHLFRLQEKPKEKTIFTVKLEKIDPAAKAKIIKEVKAIMPNMNLVEVSRIVISAHLRLR